jgi:hypothetical protein
LYVRHFTLRHPSKEGFECMAHDADITDIDKVMKEAVHASTNSAKESEDWIDTLRTGQSTDALLALLLPTMVKLEKLDLMLGFITPYLDRMMLRAIAREKPFDTQPLFPGLTDFMHAESWAIPGLQYQAMNCRYLNYFLAWPSIRSIYGHALGNLARHGGGNYPDALLRESYTRYRLTLSSISSSITHLELKKCGLSRDYLETILKTPKALTNFIYDYCPSHDFSMFDASFGDLLLALAPQYDSLENLWLEYEEKDLGRGFAYLGDNIPSLSKFRRLKHLRVPPEVLFPIFGLSAEWSSSGPTFSRPFPETLETLHFNHVKIETFLEIWAGFREFLSSGLSQVPRLRRVFVECSSSMSAPWDWKEVRDLAKSQGVELISLDCSNEGRPGHIFERGWGMDGSIKWACCSEDSNHKLMPVIRDWEADSRVDWGARVPKGPEDYFYKWHLCHDEIR